MTTRVRISATIPSGLVKELDLEAKERHKSRSQLLEECIETWCRLRMEKKMKEGYLERAESDRELAEKDLAAQVKTLPRW
jgi:metal-responsive CopG/Arc/MetJ family transcriptional regulator